MDVLTLLDRVTAAGLRVELRGGELVMTGPRSCSALAAEMGRRKAEVLAELASRAEAASVGWEALAAQRWGDADESPGIDVPGRLEDLLLPSPTDAAAIPAHPNPIDLAPADEAAPPVVATFEPVDEDDAPAWAFDDSLTVSMATIRASIEYDQATRQAEAPRRPGQRRTHAGPATPPAAGTTTALSNDTLLEPRPCP